MTAVWIAVGFAAGVFALAALIIALALLVKAFAHLLPPAGQFLTSVQDLRTQSEERNEDLRRMRERIGWDRQPGPTNGVAPPPIDFEPERRRPVSEYPTSAQVPPLSTGDVDRFDEPLTENPGERPIAPNSRLAAPPPGPKIEGE